MTERVLNPCVLLGLNTGGCAMGGAETCGDCLLIGPQCAWCSQEVKQIISTGCKSLSYTYCNVTSDGSDSVLLSVGLEKSRRENVNISRWIQSSHCCDYFQKQFAEGVNVKLF